ncbi:MAG: WD40 repeat domain-containing serine/threonine protein kinase [Verrucomicrobiota bacterium]
MSSSPTATPCPTCGAPVKPRAACPRCLLAAGLGQMTPRPSGQKPSESPTRILLSPPDLLKTSIALSHISGTLSTTLGGRVPEKFGDYELIEEIAHGGMGVVYLARQLSLERFVALKFLLDGRFSSEELRERFRREAKAAAGLRHPNIVTVHHVGSVPSEHEDGGLSEQPYYSMDFIEGRSLAEVLRNGPLAPLKAASYCRTVAEAVHYAHERWVLHRDLKPSNVLIDLDDVPHITDFGLAGKMEVRSDLSATGIMIGTPGYLSPEMAAGRTNDVCAASDIYAIGAMLYECLVGRPPFLGETLQDTLIRIREEDAVPPSLINPSVPRDLNIICLKCLEKNPAHRYASAQALADDLGSWVEHKPIQARPATVITQVTKWVKRNPSLGLLSSAILLTLLGISTVIFINNRHMRSLAHESLQQLAAHQTQTAQTFAAEHDFATAALWFDQARSNGAESAGENAPPLRHLWLGQEGKGLAFSQDGQSLHVLPADAGAAPTYDVGSGQLVTVQDSPAPGMSQPHSRLHPDGKRLIVYLNDDQTSVAVLRDAFPIRATAVSPDGRYLASTNAAGITRLWDLKPEVPKAMSVKEATLSSGHTLTTEGTLQPLSREQIQQHWKAH